MPDVPVLDPQLPLAEPPEHAQAGTAQSLPTVAVVGLGYVGLPVAVEFGKRRGTIGYDLSSKKVWRLKQFHDATGEVSAEELRAAQHLMVTDEPEHIRKADFVIVAVPTPVNDARQPDFTPLESASRIVGQNLKAGATVIYESTVYPGTTEEVCVPILERASGMRWKQDFHVGYSPERINPGDKEHCFSKIMKVVSGDDAATLEKVADLYASVVKAGVYRASSIKVAEAAKVIENTQRDLNIAFVNELAIIFDRLGIDTTEVLMAAGTKWNFLPFRPGLVGGHCIGVDPYYLTYKAELAGYHPEVILAGRRINDDMGPWIARKAVQQMIHQGRNILGAKVNILGLTFKENCKDIRNTKVVGMIRELEEYGCECFVHDPEADPDEALHEYGIRLRSWDELPAADCAILAVAHQDFLARPSAEYLEKIVRQGCLVQVKPALDPAAFRREGVRVWRL
ncbi:MAG TPA: nucleotide sugar dehydrogenase [Usitatibacter sp.]|jgi:UDP-N-acetyl-D-galactosamine dehydrogenase|nr:nucleotide sugar dehydrogenase [Usitatibacter sp.]